MSAPVDSSGPVGRSTHAPAPSLAFSAQQAQAIQQAAPQQNDITDKLKALKIEQQQQQAQGAAGGVSQSSASSSASQPPAKKKEMGAVRYAAERVIGNGSFGVVYQATVIETGETVAIKKVLQDPKFKNRELQIMGLMDHPDVISLKHCFYSKGEKPDEVYLNLVMDYIPETIHRTLRTYTKANKLLPIMYTKVYMYQIARSLSYIHSLGVCHRDIKPQNLLLNTKTHHVLLCDFGSAKVLVPGEPNVSYICSRYYRAPELVFEATQYSTQIDVWSLGCVMAEMLLGSPLFPGESAVDQLIEIIKILGTPTREEIHAMNPNHTCLVVGSEVRMADGTVRRVENLKAGMELLSSQGQTTRITQLAHGSNEPMFTIEVESPNGSGCAPMHHVVTAAHFVTLRCPRDPLLTVTDDTLTIEWFDGKALAPARMQFRLAPFSIDEADTLPVDIAAKPQLFAQWWIEAQKQQGTNGPFQPLAAGELFDIQAHQLHALMRDAESQTPYMQGIIAELGVPICFATSSSDKRGVAVDAAVAAARATSGTSTPSAASLADIIASFRANHGLSPVAPLDAIPSTRLMPGQTRAPTDCAPIAPSFADVVAAAKIHGDVFEQFAQTVRTNADGSFEYAPLVDSTIDVAYMLHNPISHDFGIDANGHKCYTLTRLESSWSALMNVTKTSDHLFSSNRILLTSVTPNIDQRSEESNCEEESYQAICNKSIEATIATSARVIVALGSVVRSRWMTFAQTSDLVQHYVVSTPADGGVTRIIISIAGRVEPITVLCAPHPSCSWSNERLASAMAEVHGLTLTGDLSLQLSSSLASYAPLSAVRPAPNGDYVTFAVDSSDHRFVLSDGCITHNSFKFPQIKPHPWPKVFRNKAPANAIDLVSKWLRYEPKSRLDPFESLAHPFFDELREAGAKMPNQQPVPEKLFQFTENELRVMQQKNLVKKLIPAHLMKNYKLPKV